MLFEGVLFLSYTGNDCYRLHKMVWDKLYPNNEKLESSPFVFTVAGVDYDKGVTAVMYRTTLRPFGAALGFKEVADYQFNSGDEISFISFIRAVKRGSNDDGKKVTKLVSPKELPDFVGDRLSSSGFAIESLSIADVVDYKLSKGRTSSIVKIAMSNVVAKVSDPELVRKAFELGVGRSKRFGCGMLVKV
jgi:hypothetical protein